MDVLEREMGLQEAEVEQRNIPRRGPLQLGWYIFIPCAIFTCIGVILAILSKLDILQHVLFGIGLSIALGAIVTGSVLYLILVKSIALPAQNREETEDRHNIELAEMRPANVVLEEPIESESTERYLCLGDLSTIQEVTSISEGKGSTDCFSEPGIQTDVEASSSTKGDFDIGSSECFSEPGKLRDVESTSEDSYKSENKKSKIRVKAELSIRHELASTSTDEEEPNSSVSGSAKISEAVPSKSDSPTDESVRTQPTETSEKTIQSSPDISHTSK